MKERILQALLNIPISILTQCSPLLIRSIEEDVSFTPCFDQKLRLLTKLGPSFLLTPTLLSQILSIACGDIVHRGTHSLIHILQFLQVVSDQINAVDIVRWAPFLLSCDGSVVREYFQLLIKLTRILEVDAMDALLKELQKNDSDLYFPFLLSLLHRQSREPLGDAVEEAYVAMLVSACEDVTNVWIVWM